MAADSRQLSHLLSRAGFGARPDEWANWSKLDLPAATQHLLHPENVPDHLEQVLRDVQGDFVDFENIDSVRGWWIYRMAHSARPLEEKIALFWHNHFATANYKVDRPALMWRQNELFRRDGLGSFRTLLSKVARDPAMLIWLDGGQNRAGAPNENFGRELLELFTMGVGNYSETDVKEAARAFTGWHLAGNDAAFDPFMHDDGTKTFLGQTGNFHGDDIIAIVAARPETATFVCTKLWKFFVHDEPKPSDIARLSKVYFQSGTDIRAVLDAIFSSPDFYADTAMNGRLKSPIELAVGALKTLDAPMLAANELGRQLAGMGQDLFNPPNVKGWREGRDWFNTRTLLARVNFCSQLVEGVARHGGVQKKLGSWIPTAPETPDAWVEAVWQVFMPGRAPSGQTRAALLQYAGAGDKEPKFAPARLPGLVGLVMATPEYQLA